MDKVFDKAWKLLAAPERWCQRSQAHDANGKELHPLNPKAIKWCVLGAVAKVYASGPTGGLDPDWQMRLQEAHRKLQKAIASVINWNDDPKRKHSEIVEKLKELDL